jgi:hypothetical protein
MITRRTLVAGLAAAAPATAVQAASARTDADILEAAFRALHPGLLRYNSPRQLDDRFARVRQAMAAASGPADHWRALSEFAAAVRCGHTFVNGANQEGRGLAFLEAGRDRLPFTFRWLHGRMVVLDPGPVAGLRPGDSVMRLGSAPTPPLLGELMAFAAADGGNDAKRVRLAELDGRELWPLPDVALPLLAPDAFGGATVVLTVRDAAGGAPRRLDAPLWTRAERVAARGSAAIAPPDAPAWRAETLAGGVRRLIMPTWALYNSRWDWRAWLDAEVDTAISTDAPAIVMDLRGNSGGEECGDHLLARMIDRDVVRPDARRFVRYRRTPPDLDRYLTTWDRTFRDWTADTQGPDGRGFYRMTRWDADDRGDVIRPRGTRYRGRLVALIDATNSSATFQFAQTLKTTRLGVLVGETTGGNRRGINGGAYFFLRLPESGFEIDLPLVATFPAKPQPDAGIEPDYPVAVTAADIARGRDPQLEAALKIARRA